jgi:hypothetical protein
MPLDYEPRPERPSVSDWLKLLWPWALMVGFVLFVVYMMLAHPGGE